VAYIASGEQRLVREGEVAGDPLQEGLRMRNSGLVEHQGRPLFLTVSIGMTVSKVGGDTPSHMLQRADAALYEAKRAGRNCVRQQLPAAEPNAATKTSSAEPRLQERITHA